MLFSRGATPKVSLPLRRFTSEFEMGRCGSIAPEAPGKLGCCCWLVVSRSYEQRRTNNKEQNLEDCTARGVNKTRIRGQALGLLVRFGYIHYCTSTSRLSTGNLPVTLLACAMRALIWRWASHLDAFSGYPLRTWLPSVYRWHDNWYTSGASLPVLSY